ncbi:MAG TPA: transcriptional regulator [Anaerolineales bacterium]|nr:transcriptional regulator [Anaerolineales bacterium]
MKDNLQLLSNLDRILHEPARLMIVSILELIEAGDFVFLLKQTELTAGNLSTHLSKLDEVGYIKIEKKFKGKMPLTLCKLTSKGQKALTIYRTQLREFLSKSPE